MAKGTLTILKLQLDKAIHGNYRTFVLFHAVLKIYL